MRLAFLSDIHIDINKEYPIIQDLGAILKKKEAEMLVIAGDISESAENTISVVKNMKSLYNIPVYYVPGNHDLWSEDLTAMPTEKIYQKLSADPNCLERHTYYIDGQSDSYALLGSVCWYDYTFAGSEFSTQMLDAMSYQDRTWQDRIKNLWTADNRTQCKKMIKNLEERLKEVQNTSIICVTHMLPIKEFCVAENQKMWNYFNAFLGSLLLEELYQSYPVKYAICGHVHYRKEILKNGIQYFCPCLGYHSEWHLTNGPSEDIHWQLEDALMLVDL